MIVDYSIWITRRCTNLLFIHCNHVCLQSLSHFLILDPFTFIYSCTRIKVLIARFFYYYIISYFHLCACMFLQLLPLYRCFSINESDFFKNNIRGKGEFVYFSACTLGEYVCSVMLFYLIKYVRSLNTQHKKVMMCRFFVKSSSIGSIIKLCSLNLCQRNCHDLLKACSSQIFIYWKLCRMGTFFMTPYL